MDKESSSTLKSPVNSPTKSEDIWLQPHQPLKQDGHSEHNRMLIDFEISVIGEEDEEAEEVLSPESAAKLNESCSDKNADDSKKVFKKVTINVEEVGEREFDRRWENNESSRDSLVQQKYRAKIEAEKETPKDERLPRVRKPIYVDHFIMVSRREDKEALKFLCNSSPSSPDGASSSQPGFLKKGSALIAKLSRYRPPVRDTNVLDGDPPRPPQPSSNDILLKHFDENVAIEDQNTSEKPENAQIVTSKTDFTNTGDEVKREFGPALDLIFWRKFVETDDPCWRAVVLKAVSFLSSAKTSEMNKLYREFLKLIEQLSYSLNSYKQIITYADQLAQDVLINKNVERLEQFNLHFPSLLLTILNAREACQVNSLYALYDLVDQKLLNIEAIQNIIIGLFDFLSVSEEIVKQYHSSEINEDGSNDEEVTLSLQCPIYLNYNWNIAHSLIFRLFYCVFCKLEDNKNFLPQEWIRETFLPKLCFYFGDSILLQKTSKCRVDFVTLLAPAAKLLGTESSEELLLPAFQRYMSDSSDVQNALLSQLFTFCKVLSPKSREIVLRDLSQLFSIDMDARCWRQRAVFANQLDLLVGILPMELVNKYLCAYALTFSADKISQVRTNGIKMLSNVLSTFIQVEWRDQKDLWRRRTEHMSDAIPVTSSDASMLTDEEPINLPLTFELLAEIRSGFWRTRSWRRRQSFANLLYLLLRHCLLTPLQFYYLFFHDFMCLSDDDVANVRQYFCLIAQLNRFEEYVGSSVIKRLEQMLVDDNDLEVRHLSKIALGKLDPLLEGLDITRRARGLVT
uniref:Uncharacterized protein n=1 Tax=Meloidogyne enterolobii TaxID=390850 RepID=A0A6V7UKI1_MELEN|nr:unnamed protein product [Meloidogyne enterolobii]